jgi:ribosomal protein S27AE
MAREIYEVRQGDFCPECGEPLVLSLRRSVVTLFMRRNLLRCPRCRFVASERQRPAVTRKSPP